MIGPDLIIISIAIGIVVSFLFSEVYGVAAGGVVVPGYVALYLDRPYPLVVTIVISIASFLITKVASQFLIVYGRRKTALHILIAFALGAWCSRLEFLPTIFALDPQETPVIGYIIPGLIAIWFDRQGVVLTTASLTIASVVVRLILLLLVGPISSHAAGT
ncbi:MAG: poly-gamma-glutamate biosynthesis protein PgsC [Myxococcota bacterium]